MTTATFELPETLRTDYIFDETNPNWERNPIHNVFFVKMMLSLFNDLLQAKGYVFVNEILSHMGIPQTRSGAIIGWSREANPNSYIDFGLDPIVENVRELHFNVDGVIIQYLPE